MSKMKCSLKVKIGKSIKVLSRADNLHENKIPEWVGLYDRYGNNGLKK